MTPLGGVSASAPIGEDITGAHGGSMPIVRKLDL